MGCHASSKGAAIAMAAALGREPAPDNIRVKAVCPDWIDTAFDAPSIRNPGGLERQRAAIEKAVPMARPPLAEEVAPMFVCAASDEASHVTCQAFAIVGGMTQQSSCGNKRKRIPPRLQSSGREPPRVAQPIATRNWSHCAAFEDRSSRAGPRCCQEDGWTSRPPRCPIPRPRATRSPP